VLSFGRRCWFAARRKIEISVESIVHSKEREPEESLAWSLHKRKREEMRTPLKLQGKEDEGSWSLGGH